MDSLLDALQEGRLIELPDNDKFRSLQFLAHIVEAISSVPNGTDVAGLVLGREKNSPTGLGKGFACPHARVPYDEDLICSIGWSPNGIDYGSPDNVPVHIIILYLVPDNQRNQYLKEISLLARALQNSQDVEYLKNNNDLSSIRNYLLDLVSNAKGTSGFEARARMIQLESTDTHPVQKIDELSNLIIEPLSIVTSPKQKHIILSQNSELIGILENTTNLIESLNTKGVFEQKNWRIIKHNISEFQSDRALYECIAVKVIGGNGK